MPENQPKELTPLEKAAEEYSCFGKHPGLEREATLERNAFIAGAKWFEQNFMKLIAVAGIRVAHRSDGKVLLDFKEFSFAISPKDARALAETIRQTSHKADGK